MEEQKIEEIPTMSLEEINGLIEKILVQMTVNNTYQNELQETLLGLEKMRSTLMNEAK